MRAVIIAFITLISFSIFLTGCNQQSSQERGAHEQETVMQRAQSSVPVPRTTHFQTRKTVAKWMNRMDKPNKVFYIYLLGDNGNTIGYYVANTRPVSICALLTPPKHITRTSGSIAVLPSPALDGVYYAGGSCNSNYFFDAETDAYIEISDNIDFFVSDQPLSLKAKPITVITDK